MKNLIFELPDNVWGNGSKVAFTIQNFTKDILSIKKIGFSNTRNNPVPCWGCLKELKDAKNVRPVLNIRRKELTLFPLCADKVCYEKLENSLNKAIDKIAS